jgi:hypothetical protein
MARVVEAPVTLTAYPNLRQMAEILEVAKSTLSQRKLSCEAVGNQKRYRPRIVLEEALYRRRTLVEVGQKLVEHAQRVAGADLASAVQQEVATALSALADEPAPVRLEKLSQEFDRILERMQDPRYYSRLLEVFENVTPEALGRAAVAQARVTRSGGNG